MAVYRIGDILRMKREALGITREKLCELSNDICSVQTLYRIECGKVKVKQELYRQLMKCMGELTERNYASIVVSENQYLNLKSEIHAHIFYGEYQQAEEKLLQLKQEMNPRYIRNKQYLMEKRATLAYRQNKMTSEEYKDILFDALRCTIPHFDQIDIAHWPLNNEEFTILSYILNIYHSTKQREKELELLFKLKQNVEKRYMEEDYYIVRHTYVMVMLSQIMSITNHHQEAIDYCKQGIEESQKQRIIGNVNELFYDIRYRSISVFSNRFDCGTNKRF